MRLAPVMLLALLGIAWPAAGHAEAPADARCQALTRANLGADAQLTSAAWRPAAGVAPAACQVKGVADGRVTFQLWLPEAWNGLLARVDAQFAHLGCTGAECGEPVTPEACEGVLERGYACLTHDFGAPARALDTAWLRGNPQAALDLAFRATHLATVAGKAVVRERYGRDPAQSYFLGCSQGGRQGLIEAERFPADYDGVVAGAPLLDPIGNQMALLWNISALIGPDGRTLFPAPNGGYLQPDLRLLHAAILAQCDLNDGARDGVIGDPRQCHFDVGVLRCPGAKTPQCLTADQVTAVRRILDGPRDAEGRPLYPAQAMLGSEANWGYSYLSPDGGDGARRRMLTALDDQALTFAPISEAASDWASLAKATALPRALYAASDPDLRAFAARGGRLIMYEGWTDHEVLPEAVAAYADAVGRTLGGPAAGAAVMRLFMVPGMDHCGNGVAADKIDYLAALDAWVRSGKAPDRLIAARIKDKRVWPADPDYWTPAPPDPARVEFTRPVFPYPLQAKYQGSGDPTRAENFVAASP